MRKIAVVTLATGLAAILGIQTAAAQTKPNTDAQIKAQCPAAFAWHAAHHNGLSAEQRQKLKAIKPSDTGLAEQLARRYDRDQAAEEAAVKANAFSEPRAEAIKLPQVKHLVFVQKADLDWFKKIFAAHGFPTVQQVGVHGVEHAWMLVQHADMDRPFQAKVLTALQPRLASEPFLRNDYALLLDRVRVNDRKPQIYGTQFTTKDGRLVMSPTEDERGLDARRAKMGLMPIADYRCVIDVAYHLPHYEGSSDSARGAKAK